jgi:hypothetical protein
VAAVVALLVEAAHHVGAQQRDRVLSAQLVPHLLQPDRRLLVAVAPQDVDHLAVGAHPHSAVTAPAEIDLAADHALEPLPVRHGVDHQARQRLARVQEADPPLCGGVIDVDALFPQAVAEDGAVRLGRDDHERLARAQTGREIVRDQAAEVVVALVELDDVALLGQTGQELCPDLLGHRR